MSKVVVFDHPLIMHKLSIMRDKSTVSKDFRQLLQEISLLMGYEVTRDLPLTDVEIETPICKTTQKMLAGRSIGVVPILRAGLGMVDGILTLVPTAKVGHIGCYRDEKTAKPVEYYCKLPADAQEREIIVVDPMLATGGSAIMAINFIKAKGVKNIKFMCLIAAPEGVKALQEAHPDVDIFIACLDEKLNENKYIVPGLGDAGDRIFGTK
ncbi:MAG: uracil phosphoribosyltransferase [Clostridia bacterium]|nr:uracil phosphoribosyltransferase [Clostridia bacterium]